MKRRTDQKVSCPIFSRSSPCSASTTFGIYISMGGFSKDAETEARHQENHRVTLIDLPRLLGLRFQHYAALTEADRQLLPLKPVYDLASRA